MRTTIFRTCIVTRKLLSKEEMFRVVKTPNHEIKIDLDGNVQGRGAYLSKDKSVIEGAKKRRTLEKALRVNDCQNVYDQLIDLLK